MESNSPKAFRIFLVLLGLSVAGLLVGLLVWTQQDTGEESTLNRAETPPPKSLATVDEAPSAPPAPTLQIPKPATEPDEDEQAAQIKRKLTPEQIEGIRARKEHYRLAMLERQKQQEEERRKDAEARAAREAAEKISGQKMDRAKGLIEQAEIQYNVRRYLPATRACYENRLKDIPTLAGKITLEYVVGINGKVKQVAVTNSSLHDEKVERCLVSVVKRFRFPELKDKREAVLEYPIVFEPKH